MFLFLINCFTNGSSQKDFQSIFFPALNQKHPCSFTVIYKKVPVVFLRVQFSSWPAGVLFKIPERGSKYQTEKENLPARDLGAGWSDHISSCWKQTNWVELGSHPMHRVLEMTRAENHLACAARCSACILMLEKSRSKLKEQKQTWKLVEGPSND